MSTPPETVAPSPAPAQAWPAQVREQADDLPPSMQAELHARLVKRGVVNPMAAEHLAVVVEVTERLFKAYGRKRLRSREAATKKRQEKKAAPVEQPPALVPAGTPDQPAPTAPLPPR